MKKLHPINHIEDTKMLQQRLRSAADMVGEFEVFSCILLHFDLPFVQDATDRLIPNFYTDHTKKKKMQPDIR